MRPRHGLKAASLFDDGQAVRTRGERGQVLAAEAGFNACDAAMQTLGGFGYAKEYHVERLWREVRSTGSRRCRSRWC